MNGKDEIRFHCFGECDGDWDIYDVIMLKDHCNFQQAQEKFTEYLGLEDVEFHRGRYQYHDDESNEQEEPIASLDDEDFTDEHRKVLQESAGFYNHLLLSQKDEFEKVIKYLKKRDVGENTILKYNIGFCPALNDEKYESRALLNQYVEKFKKDLSLYQCFRRAGLFRLLNDQSSPAYPYYSQFIDRTPGNIFGGYTDYFQNRITFPIYNIDGRIEGIIGRRTDNRGVRLLKQNQEDTYI